MQLSTKWFFFQVDTVCHGDELPILFHTNLTSLGGTYTDKEITLVKEMQGYWAAFAKQGAPASSGKYQSVLSNIVQTVFVQQRGGSTQLTCPQTQGLPPHHKPCRCFVLKRGTHHCPMSRISVLGMVVNMFFCNILTFLFLVLLSFGLCCSFDCAFDCAFNRGLACH